MSDETTTIDHAETIELARRLKDAVTPGRWAYSKSQPDVVIRLGDGGYCNGVFGLPIAQAIVAVPDLLAALVALADERDALRARVAELERTHDNLRQALDAFCIAAADARFDDADARREALRIGYGLHGIEG